jgi:YesN/AraC family two-component response regulator
MISLMIADDEAIVRNGLRDAIDWDALGVTVTDCVGDGLALVERAIASHADILLVDIRMPGLSGLDAIEEIRKKLPDCECIIFTAHEDFAYARRALELGVLAYITKPVFPRDVISKVKIAVERILSRREKQEEDQQGTPVERIRQFMIAHLSEQVSLSSVAEYMQMNPAYLSRYFKEKTGQNFVDYHRQLRMERAKELLRGTSLKVYEIADQIGYVNAQHFVTAFREYEGITPFAYRQGTEEKGRGSST